MIDKSKRYLRTRYALDTNPTLQGKRIHFDSVAEMFTTRAQEIPDTVHVYYYDEIVTYAQTNERSNRVANYLKANGVKKGDVYSKGSLILLRTYPTPIKFREALV